MLKIWATKLTSRNLRAAAPALGAPPASSHFNLLSIYCGHHNHHFLHPQQQQSNCLSTHKSVAKLLEPKNEPILDYVSDPRSKHRLELEHCLTELSNQVQEIPILIGGKEYKSDEVRYQRIPFDHGKKLAKFYHAPHELILKAANESIKSASTWSRVPVGDKLEIFERAANLVSGKYRQQLNAATILGQAKTVRQAEIDSAGELADFLRFNAHYLRQLMAIQPVSPTDGEHNSTHLRPLDGFVAAISPFNFTAIGGNLASAPAMMGNTIVWKPSDTAVLSNYVILKLLLEAGLPRDVINFIPSDGLDFGRVVTAHRRLGGINFTGSVATFRWLWTEVGLNIKRYETFPRLVGECGGKNFHLVHKSAHEPTAVAQTIRSAFEYSGQKCSACSRLYVASSVWASMKDKLVAIVRDELKLGPANDLSVFTSAVIDENAFKRCNQYLDYARANSNEMKILCGGVANNQPGYFVQPTIIETTNPRCKLMVEEIFGPILTVYVYPDADIDKTLELIDCNPFALTGAIFAQDESFIEHAMDRLRMSAGNLYINDKSTGAIVGQQPFGGWRHSGTNDKAGSQHYLMRWCNQQTIKRTTTNMTKID